MGPHMFLNRARLGVNPALLHTLIKNTKTDNDNNFTSVCKKLCIIYITTKYIAKTKQTSCEKLLHNTYLLKITILLNSNIIHQLNALCLFLSKTKTLGDAYFLICVRKMTRII